MKTSILLVSLGLAWSGKAAAREIVVEGRDSAAIAAAVAASQAGDTVRLPAGTYEISEAIVPKSGTRVVGAGQAETVVRFAGEKPSVLVRLDQCEDVGLGDFTLDGASDPRVTQGIVARDARRLTIRRVTVRNLVKTETFGPHGIHLSGINPTREKGVTDSVIEGCTIENVGVGADFGCGIRLSLGSSRNRVENCTVRTTGRGGIFADNGSTDLVIRGNTVSGSGGERLGIEVWGGCDRCVIEDNRIDHWLSIGGCDWCAVRRNTVSATDGTFGFCGIEAIGSYLIFTDNLVDDGQLIGLSVSSSQPKRYVYYGNNTFRRSTQWGAQLQGESGGIAYHYFYRCRFIETTVGREKVWFPGDEGHGFRINGNTSHLVLEECEITNNGRLGVQVTVGDVDYWSFLQCSIRGNRGAAVSAGPAINAVEWVDCTVEGNGRDDLPAAKAFPRASPRAAFEAPARARVGEAVRFQSRAEAAEGAIAKVLWDLGDGPPLVGDEVSWTYARPGKYRVTQIVWDDSGRAGRAESAIEVEGRRS